MMASALAGAGESPVSAFYGGNSREASRNLAGFFPEPAQTLSVSGARQKVFYSVFIAVAVAPNLALSFY